MVRLIKHRGFLVAFSTGIFILIFGAVLLGFAANEIYFLRPAEGAEIVVVEIPEGAAQTEIGAQLAERNLISSQLLFRLYAKWRGADTIFQRGKFEIVRGSSMRRILNQLTVARAEERSITIIEGWTMKDIADYFEESLGLPREEFLAAARNVSWPEEFAFLRVRSEGADLEGFLFPDTYRVLANATAVDVLRRQLQNFQKRVREISYEDLILASIVEREVRGERDRRIVADIFRRRLDIGMALQADSTVNYVTGKRTPALSAADKVLDTPYNTYKYRGLPPGPISNPGLESIEAVRLPIANDYWFFLTDKEGNVHYAKSLEEHNMNKARYLR